MAPPQDVQLVNSHHGTYDLVEIDWAGEQPHGFPSRNDVIKASTSPGRRVTPTCVVPGSTASCAFGRSPNSSTTSGNGEKSRSPKISRVGACSDRSSSAHPGNPCTIADVLAANSSKCAGSGATAW